MTGLVLAVVRWPLLPDARAPPPARAVEDSCAAPDRYDTVLDLVGRSVRDLHRLVLPTRTLILSGGVSGEGRWIGPLGLLVRAQMLALLPGPRIVTPRAMPSAERLEAPVGLVASGSVTPVIDRAFDLDHGDALRPGWLSNAVTVSRTEQTAHAVTRAGRSDRRRTRSTVPHRRTRSAP